MIEETTEHSMTVQESIPEQVPPSLEELQTMANNMAEARSQDPSEMAASFHALYTQRFAEGIASVGSNSAKRIAMFLVNYPLLQEDINSSTDTERQLAYLGNQLIEAKFIMIMNEYQKNLQKAQKEALEQAEQTTEPQGETDGVQA